jgi:hypothetical protein
MDALLQTAQGNFDTASATAAQLIGNAQLYLATVTGNANLAIANASQTLTVDQGNAGIAEATATGLASTTAAQAQTQFAGSGMVINVYGENLIDPVAVGQSVGWQIRTLVPA